MSACALAGARRCHHVRVVSQLSSRLRRSAVAVSGLLLALSACTSDPVAESATPSTATSSSASAAAPSSSGDEVAEVPGRGGALTVLLQQDPSPVVGWTPWDHVCAWGCRSVLDHVLETLTVMLPDGSVEPWLAESVTPNDDLTEWTVVLRGGINFSDGEPVTATRIKEGHEEFLKDGKATEGLLRDARVSGVQAPDALTLVYELSEPNAGLPSLLAGPAGRVFSVEAARIDAAGFLRAPIGTGPFVFESWSVGENPVLAANPNYWRTAPDGTMLPLLDRLIFVEVADEQERLDRLRAGEGQVLQTRAPRAVQQAREMQFTVIAHTEDNVGAIVFNTLESPFDDPRVRRALLLAYDQEALLSASGVADVTPAATQWWGPDSIWYSSRAAGSWPDTDIEESRRLLAEYESDPSRSDEREMGEPIEVRVQCTDDLQLSNMARALEGQWEATGLVDVEVEVVSRSGLIQRVMGAVTDRPSFSGDFTVTCWRMGGESDPWTLLSTALGPVKTSPLNIANLEDEELSELVGLVQTSPTFATRRAAVEQIMVIFAVEAPALYLGHSTTAVVGTDQVFGLGSWTLPSGREVFGQLGGVGRYAEVGRS